MRRLLVLGLLLAALPLQAQDAPFASAQALLDRLDAIGAMTDAAERDAAETALLDSLRAADQVPFTLADSAVFLYRGTNTTVRVAGDLNGWNPANGPLARVGLSTLWKRLYTFPPAARLDYKLVADGTWILDPNNPHQQWSGFGPNSELRMPDWVFPEETVRDPDVPQGAFTGNQTIQSAQLGYAVHYRVYTPAGYEGLADLPVLYITDGQEYSDDRLGATRIVLDNLIHDGRAAPALAVFVDPREVGNPSNNQRAEQYVENPAFAAFLAEELAPAIDAAYRTQPDREHRAILGTSLGGLFSAYLGLLHPETFGRLAIQSPAFWVSENPDWWDGPLSIYQMMAAAPDSQFTVYMSTGTINDTEAGARRMRDVLQANGHALTYREVPEGHSWGNWRALIDEALMALLPGPAVLDAEPPALPGDTGLRLDSAPNPARERTTLRFSLTAPATVDLTCYDARGRQVAPLLDGAHFPAGDFAEAFAADSAGTYLCRLWTAHGQATRLVTLVP